MGVLTRTKKKPGARRLALLFSGLLLLVVGTSFDLPWRPIWERHDVVDDSDRSLRVVHAPSFDYPYALRKAEVEGTVDLELTVDPDGRVMSVTVGKSSGSSLLDAYAEKTARGFLFAPNPRSGPRQTTIRVGFHLNPSPLLPLTVP